MPISKKLSRPKMCHFFVKIYRCCMLTRWNYCASHPTRFNYWQQGFSYPRDEYLIKVAAGCPRFDAELKTQRIEDICNEQIKGKCLTSTITNPWFEGTQEEFESSGKDTETAVMKVQWPEECWLRLNSTTLGYC